MAQSLEPRNCIRRVATVNLLQLGDLNRFKAKFLQAAQKSQSEQKSGQDRQGAADASLIESQVIEKVKAQALTFYNRAKTVFPHEGKVYHLLAQISVKESDYLSAVYNCMRALSCSYPTTSSETRENLINMFQEIRMKDIEESKLELTTSVK